MLSLEDRSLIDETFADFAKRLDAHHATGFGIFPSADPESNYFNQVWARDASHYFVHAKPDAVIDSLRTLFAHQRANGALPSRVEREYQVLKLTPGMRRFHKPLFHLLETRWCKRRERLVHEGRDGAGGEDSVPVVTIAAGELFSTSHAGREFIAGHFENLVRAMTFFEGRVDAADGLAVASRSNPDWADTILRRGKLGGVNLFSARALQAMQRMAQALGDLERARHYEKSFQKTQASAMKTFYDADGAFFRAEASDNRLDAVASIFGALYFLPSEEAARVERTLKRRVSHGSGLVNFDPPYPQRDISWAHRLMGQWLYHNAFVWPWVIGQNVQVKIKIALEHGDAEVRAQFRREAVEDVVKLAKLFRAAGGPYEVFLPEEAKPGETRWYHPPRFLWAVWHLMKALMGAFGSSNGFNHFRPHRGQNVVQNFPQIFFENITR